MLTGIYPIWFAQSSLAHADIFAAACSLWGMVCVLPESDRKPRLAALWFAAAVLSKETAVVIPLTLIVANLFAMIKGNSAQRIRQVRESGWLACSILPLAAWYGWHYKKTGFVSAIPIICATTRNPISILCAFSRRLVIASCTSQLT